MAWSGDDPSFQEFIDRHALTFPQISDRPAEVFDRFGVIIQPAAAIVAADGEVTLLTGRADGEAIVEALTPIAG